MKYTPYKMQDVGIAESKHLFNVISTFAGGGGSSTGYRLAGGHILAINEFVEEARTTYQENYPNTLIIPDDIKKLTGEDLINPDFIKLADSYGVAGFRADSPELLEESLKKAIKLNKTFYYAVDKQNIEIYISIYEKIENLTFNRGYAWND